MYSTYTVEVLKYKNENKSKKISRNSTDTVEVLKYTGTVIFTLKLPFSNSTDTVEVLKLMIPDTPIVLGLNSTDTVEVLKW